MILLNCDGGLCNRMRSIDAAIEISTNTNQTLEVIWPINRWLKCEYTDLFVNTGAFIIRSKKWYHYTGQPRQSKNFIKKHIGIMLEKSLYDRTFYENDRFNRDIKDIDHGTFKDFKSIYITNSNNFLGTPRHYKCFKPIQVLQQKIDQTVLNFGVNTIGVHIRRTDNVHSITISTDEAFVHRMNNLLDQDPNIKFYLATDAEKTEEYFRKMFGSAIITFPKIFGRDTKQAMQDAVIDLYSLASTKKILASYFSSFSETAAAIGQIPIEIIKCQI